MPFKGTILTPFFKGAICALFFKGAICALFFKGAILASFLKGHRTSSAKGEAFTPSPPKGSSDAPQKG